MAGLRNIVKEGDHLRMNALFSSPGELSRSLFFYFAVLLDISLEGYEQVHPPIAPVGDSSYLPAIPGHAIHHCFCFLFAYLYHSVFFHDFVPLSLMFTMIIAESGGRLHDCGTEIKGIIMEKRVK